MLGVVPNLFEIWLNLGQIFLHDSSTIGTLVEGLERSGPTTDFLKAGAITTASPRAVSDSG